MEKRIKLRASNRTSLFDREIKMRALDVHAHLTPQAMWKAIDSGKDWYGARFEVDEQGQQWMVNADPRIGPTNPKLRFTPEERIIDMDELGVTMQVVSVAPALYDYHLDPEAGLRASREVNNEIASMTTRWPQRFAGLATLPMQDIKVAIGELERSVTQLGLKGAELDTVVNDRNWDEPEFYPFFKAAEEMGALLFFHPAGSLVWQRTNRYYLGNSIGNTVEDTLVVATLIFGGILDQCPGLKVCIAHGGGPACFGMGRMDRGWQVRPEGRVHIHKPPSTYLRRMYYDCITHSEAALRFMIDAIGIDRIVLGSDWPYDMGFDSPVEWVSSMTTLTQEEKDQILWRNLGNLLDLPYAGLSSET